VVAQRPAITGCRIYYGDLSVRTDWATAPNTNVQAVVWLDDQGGATYAWGVDTYTPPPNATGYSGTKAGGSVNTNRFNQILEKVKTENGWGR
jgi:hypothetical protein